MRQDSLDARPAPVRRVLTTAVLLAVALLAAPAIADFSARTSGGSTVTTLTPAPPDKGQIDTLADGLVTHSEMLRALETMVECINDAGYEAYLVEFTPRHGWHTRTAGANSEEADAAETAAAGCYRRHVGQAAAEYSKTYSFSIEEKARVGKAIEKCLEAGGLSYDGLPSAVDLPKGDVEAFNECERMAILNLNR